MLTNKLDDLPVDEPSKFQIGNSSGAFGKNDTVFVLARRYSPVPSIQTYMHWILSSGCFSDKYLAKIGAWQASETVDIVNNVDS